MFVLEIAVFHIESRIVDEPVVEVFTSKAEAIAFAVGFADGRDLLLHSDEHSRRCGRDLVATVQVED